MANLTKERQHHGKARLRLGRLPTAVRSARADIHGNNKIALQLAPQAKSGSMATGSVMSAGKKNDGSLKVGNPIRVSSSASTSCG